MCEAVDNSDVLLLTRCCGGGGVEETNEPNDPTTDDAALAAALAEQEAGSAGSLAEPVPPPPIPPNERCVVEGPGLQQVAGIAGERTYFMVACFKVSTLIQHLRAAPAP